MALTSEPFVLSAGSARSMSVSTAAGSVDREASLSWSRAGRVLPIERASAGPEHAAWSAA
ncbi:MAG: hypothetical protein ACKVU4_00435 [Phycisphaerales bacterium]